MANFNDFLNKLNDTKDYTSKMSADDIKKNQGVMGILCYISWLFLIPFFMVKDSKFIKFHANQGFTLALIETIGGGVCALLGIIPLIGILFRIIGGLVGLCCLILTIIGILNILNGKAKELPFIGIFRFIK